MIGQKNNRMKKYRQKMNDSGFYWLCHWVPVEHKEKIKAYAKKLRGKV